ncbi:hypothetical protein LXA43DRAFT_1011665 [Ganoderma leucocontextum]|nr:hypothetical protein LXA43DRAFT_1011665 [Ganoderma leucocontextum]
MVPDRAATTAPTKLFPPYSALAHLFAIYFLPNQSTAPMDVSPIALFDSYEADLKQIIHSIRDKLDGNAKDVQDEQCKAAFRRVEMELDDGWSPRCK